MGEDIKSDLAGIAITHPFFADMVTNALNYIEELEKENKELKEDNEQLDAIKNEAVRRYNFESIPKSKVKEKIEELDNERRKFTSDNVNNFYLQEFTRKYTQKSDHDYGVFGTPETITYCINNELLGRIEVLQELLEEE